MTTRPPTEKKPTPIPPRVRATPVVAFPHHPPSPTLHHRAGSRTALPSPLSSRMRGPIPFPPPPVRGFAPRSACFRNSTPGFDPVRPKRHRAETMSRRPPPCLSYVVVLLPMVRLASQRFTSTEARRLLKQATLVVARYIQPFDQPPRRAGSRTALPHPLSSRMRGPIPFPHLPSSRPSSSPSPIIQAPSRFSRAEPAPRSGGSRTTLPLQHHAFLYPSSVGATLVSLFQKSSPMIRPSMPRRFPPTSLARIRRIWPKVRYSRKQESRRPSSRRGPRGGIKEPVYDPLCQV